jgi:predicted amidohydrolase YtcJ
MHIPQKSLKIITFFFALFAKQVVFSQSNNNNFNKIEIHTAKKIIVGDTGFSNVDAIAIQNGYIIQTGGLDALKKSYPNSKVFKHSGVMYPGLIDAHCHFLAYCKGTTELNVYGIKSPEKISQMTKKFSKKTKRQWVVGRGWDQHLWGGEFPLASDLKNAGNKPVCLSRVDGHAIWVNEVALKTLNLNWDTTIYGGEIIKDKNGNPTGVFIDNAADWIKSYIPSVDDKILEKAVIKHAKDCYKYGLTTLDEAGLEINEIKFIDRLQKENKLSMRFYTMLAANEKSIQSIVTYDIPKSERLSCHSMKIYFDGALGSRGALLKNQYCDRHDHFGLRLIKPEEFNLYSSILLKNNFQVCVHAIGDSANSLVLRSFRQMIPEGYDARWRIEHAQIVDPRDQKIFSERSIIPSIQPTHATSDAPWADSRLCADGKQRVYGGKFYDPKTGAYAYQSLLKSSGIVALGTDFPVEAINPFATFYSATERLDIQGNLTTPFKPEQALSRKDALLGMTLWAAYANKEESVKGSLEVGKYADFVILNQDLLTIESPKIKKTKVKKTYIGGQRVY